MVWTLLLLFKIVIAFITVSIQFYFYQFLHSYTLQRRSGLRIIFLLRIVFSIFTIPILLMFFWGKWIAHVPPPLLASVLYPVYCWHFSWFIIFLLVSLEYAIRQGINGFRWLLNKMRSPATVPPDVEMLFQPTRRKFLQQSFIVATGTIFSTTVYGAIAHDQFELTRISVPIRDLPNEFDEFTIALLSDVHSSIFMTKDTMQNYVRATNELHPDLIAVTGDFVNSMVEEVYPFAEAFSALYAPNGIFGVLGNHDYYTKNVETVASVVNECGIRLFRNEHVLIRRKRSSIILGGIDDVSNSPTASRLTDLALEGTTEQPSKIFLSHRPYYFPQFSSRKIDLTLSGHTHGGQIVLARFGNNVVAPARIASPYVAGLYTRGSSKMYVSRGIGTVAVPIRINCPPEITLITLLSSAS